MEKYFIKIKDNLTSFVFYNTLLKKLHRYYVEDGIREIVFDFSLLKSIDANVIPNLLCMGYIIREHSNHVPNIYIPDNINCGAIKRYLNDINFIYLAQEYNLFKFNDGVHGGWSEMAMDKHNITILFDKNETEEESWSKLIHYSDKFARKYLADFYQKIEYEKPQNIILQVSKEIIENSKIHGKSFIFMTIQYNYKLEKIYLSYSDCGMGFLKSLLKESELNKLDICSELDGIIYAIFKRVVEKDYGLYSVITKVLFKHGVIRIHSNNTQLILTEKKLLEVTLANSVEKFKEIVKSEMMKNNIRENLKYGGVHIEIEIPLKKEEVNRNVL